MTEARTDRERLRALHQSHVDDLCARYARVLQKHALDAVVLHTGTAQQRSIFDDQYWPLVVVPHTRHWMPLAVADCAVVVEQGRKPRLLVNTERGYWEGPPAPESDHFWSAFDVLEVDGPDRIRALLPSSTQGKRTAFVGEDRARGASWGFAEADIAPAALLKDLDALRVAKSEYERVCLVEANARACRGHAAVLRAFESASPTDIPSELDLHLLYLQHTQQDDPETPYKNIVALGEHAATLHHVSYGRQRSHAQSLLLDAGATFCGYDSDITRTAVRGTGAAADAFRGIVAGVEKLQQELCARAKPGVPYEQLHNQCHELLAQVFVDVKLAKSGTTANALVESGMTRKLLPHGLGHSLGIQTHDVGCRNINPEPRNPFLRNTAVIAADQVFTIEPGCYFIESLLKELRAEPIAADLDWKLMDALVPFGGVRIEDDIRVTADGHENMTRAFLAAGGSVSAVLFEQPLAPGVSFIGREIELTGKGDFLVMETEGLPRDLAFVIPAADAELRFGQAAGVLSMIANAVAQGAAFDVGDCIALSEPVFDAYEGIGFAPAHALPMQRKGTARMIGVPLFAEEVACAQRSGLPRVLARLGQVDKFFPYGPWIARERAAVITQADLAGSLFSSGMPAFGEFAALVHDNVITLRPGPRAGHELRNALGASRPFLSATPVDDSQCGIAVVFAGAGKPPRGVARGGLQGPAGLAFVVVTLGTEKQGATSIEDGVGIVLSPAHAAQWVEALDAGRAVELEPAEGRMPVVLEPTSG